MCVKDLRLFENRLDGTLICRFTCLFPIQKKFQLGGMRCINNSLTMNFGLKLKSNFEFNRVLVRNECPENSQIL